MEDNRHFTKNLFISFLIVFIFMVFWQMYVGKNVNRTRPGGSDTTQVYEGRNEVSPKVRRNAFLKETDSLTAIDTLWNTELAALHSAEFDVKIAKLGTYYDVYLKKYKTHLLDTSFVRFFFTGYEGYTSKDSVISVKNGTRVVFVSRDTLKIKSFTYKPDSYLVDFAYENREDSSVSVEFYGDLYLNPHSIKEEKRLYEFVVKTNKNYKKFSVNKLLKKQRAYEYPLKDIEFVGLKNKYFMFVVVNNNHEDGRLIFGIKSGKPYFKITENKNNAHFLVYHGPIEYFLLKKIGYGLFANYDFGGALIAPFSMAMLYIFKFLHSFVPNWGWTIVLFALLMKIVFFPLTYKGLASMRKMQRLKPEIDKLQKIYKNDPQKLQKEMMELYKKHGVNPFSGCITLVIQLPIFWALYRILRMTIDLRGAEFIWWIKDLSAKDPYYILPILMGITSIVQAKLQQTGTQDGQAKLFTYFMPVFLVIIFISLPSGIVLYWFAYNLFSVFETLLIKRLEVS